MTYDARSDFYLELAVTDGDFLLLAPDALPTCRLFGATGFVAELDAEPFQTAAVTDVDPNGSGGSRLTAAGHPFAVGDVLVIAGVGGATGVNGTRTVTAAAADTFDVAAAPGGTYTSGGLAGTKGLYRAVAGADARGNLEPGRAYTAVWRYAVGGSPAVQTEPFAVV